MDFRTIRYEKLGAVLRITANRPEVLNAQSRVMILELDEAFRAASEDDETRVIIVARPASWSRRSTRWAMSRVRSFSKIPAHIAPESWPP